MPSRQPSGRAHWVRASEGPGFYVSADERFTAELRAPGFYPDLECKLQRHYAIRLLGTMQIIGTATTLAEAARLYGVGRGPR